MPRTGPSIVTGYKNTGSGMMYLTSKNYISQSMVMNSGLPDLSPIRAIIAETMTRIVRRDPNTNGVLAGIATGRVLLKESIKEVNNDLFTKY